MACMCGDYCCSSCGPAQGNSKCELCGQWASEGCEHYDEETGDYKKEFIPQLEELHRKEEEMWAKLEEAEKVYLDQSPPMMEGECRCMGIERPHWAGSDGCVDEED